MIADDLEACRWWLMICTMTTWRILSALILGCKMIDHSWTISSWLCGMISACLKHLLLVIWSSLVRMKIIWFFFWWSFHVFAHGTVSVVVKTRVQWRSYFQNIFFCISLWHTMWYHSNKLIKTLKLQAFTHVDYSADSFSGDHSSYVLCVCLHR